MKAFPFDKDYLRSSIFGFEDALVSTTGVVAGISVGDPHKEIVVLASLVLIAVEALSMGVGQFFSEQTIHEMQEGKSHKDNLVMGSVIMFGSYVAGGLIPILPVLILPFSQAVIGSLGTAFIGLFILGFIKGRIVGVNPARSALQMLIIGGIATGIGALVGLLLKV